MYCANNRSFTNIVSCSPYNVSEGRYWFSDEEMETHLLFISPRSHLVIAELVWPLISMKQHLIFTCGKETMMQSFELKC